MDMQARGFNENDVDEKFGVVSVFFVWKYIRVIISTSVVVLDTSV